VSLQVASSNANPHRVIRDKLQVVAGWNKATEILGRSIEAVDRGDMMIRGRRPDGSRLEKNTNRPPGSAPV